MILLRAGSAPVAANMVSAGIVDDGGAAEPVIVFRDGLRAPLSAALKGYQVVEASEDELRLLSCSRDFGGPLIISD